MNEIVWEEDDVNYELEDELCLEYANVDLDYFSLNISEM